VDQQQRARGELDDRLGASGLGGKRGDRGDLGRLRGGGDYDGAAVRVADEPDALDAVLAREVFEAGEHIEDALVDAAGRDASSEVHAQGGDAVCGEVLHEVGVERVGGAIKAAIGATDREQRARGTLDGAVDDADAPTRTIEPELAGPRIVVRGHHHVGEPTRASA